MTRREKIEAQLSEAGEVTDRARSIEKERPALIRKAKQAGVPVAQAARLLQISRPSAYRLLDTPNKED